MESVWEECRKCVDDVIKNLHHGKICYDGGDNKNKSEYSIRPRVRRHDKTLQLQSLLWVKGTTVYVPLYDLYRKQRRLQGHYHDGRYWVRMPYKDFPRMFPELPAAIVSKALGRLEDEGLLRMVHYGRRSWYAITRITSACRPENVLY